MAITQKILNVTNEEYHTSDEFYDYWSSSYLKNYLLSPLEAKVAHDEHKVITPTPAMKLGSLVHDALEYIHNTGDFSLRTFYNDMAYFEPPINPKTNAPYGENTIKYSDAFLDFLAANTGKRIINKDWIDIVNSIARSAERNNIVGKIVIHGEAEVSHFIEDDGAKFKVRPDLNTKSCIFDYKTIDGALTEENLVNRVINSGYAFQAAMYQWAVHMTEGVWKSHYIIFMQTCEPYGICVFSMKNFAYDVVDGIILNSMSVGARQWEIVKDLHTKCIKDDSWPEREIYIAPDEKGRRILEPECPAWAMKKIVEPYF